MKKENLLNINQNGDTIPFADDEIDLKPHKLIRIAVTGDVFLNRLETKIIDTKEFQRLRKLKQLGSTNLVFPTALHTRFDHSLGTMQVASEMVRYIRENRHNQNHEKEINDAEHQLIRLLALLHDIGHIPYGHTIEDEFSIFGRHDEDTKRIDRFVGPKSIIGGLIIAHIGKRLYDRFYNLITVKKKDIPVLGNDAFIYDIVNNTVCADLLDYLKRDYFFCNLPLGIEYRFLNFLYIYKDEKNNCKRTAIRLWKEGETFPRASLLDELVSLLEHRYKIGEIAYFHHTKLISGAMLAGAVKRALLYDSTLLTKEMMYEMGDEELILKLKSSNDPIVRKLINAFDERELWKNAYTKKRTEIVSEQKRDETQKHFKIINQEFHADSTKRLEIEKKMAIDLGMEDGDVLIHCPKDDMQLKYAEMKVFWEGEYEALCDCEDSDLTHEKLKLILQSHENLFAIRVFLNPKFKDKQADVELAAKMNFCLNKSEKRQFEIEYVNRVVDLNMDKIFDSQRISHGEILNYKEKVKEKYLNPTKSDRDPETVLEIMKEVADEFHFRKE